MDSVDFFRAMAKANKRTKVKNPDHFKHILYEAAVQAVDVDIDFIQRGFKRLRKRKAKTLREDFCGTALLCCAWVKQSKTARAWGIDLDRTVLAWGQENRVQQLTPSQQQRVILLEEDVMKATTPPVDALCALNFSYQIFDTRNALKAYFKAVYDALEEDGLFFLDHYSGPGAQDVTTDEREVDAGVDFAGNPYPAFTYFWEQGAFDLLSNKTSCRIHFKVPGHKKMKRAFEYQWRLWSPAELKEVLLDAGFRDVEFHIEEWDEELEDTNGEFRIRTSYYDMYAFISYIIAIK